MVNKEDEAIDAIRRRNTPDVELRISRSIPGFLDGELIIVDVLKDHNRIGENYYYSHRYASRSFTSMDELALWIGQNQYTSAPEIIFPTPIFQRFGISAPAFIAGLITVTICVIVIWMAWRGQQIIIPDILSNALTVILGFYFGSQVGRLREAVSTRQAGQDVTKEE